MSDHRLLHLVDEGGLIDEDGRSWLARASADDRQVLARAQGPVLDVGCGPGRHVHELCRRRVDVLGIDVTPSMLDTAADRGLPVLEVSVFDRLPRMGQWQTAVLLDGNSGLGGDPLRLLRRLRSVLCSDGRVLADLATGPWTKPRRLRLRHGGRHGPHFAWAPLHLDDLATVAMRADMDIVDVWKIGPRWFCELTMAPVALAATGGAEPDVPDEIGEATGGSASGLGEAG